MRRRLAAVATGLLVATSCSGDTASPNVPDTSRPSATFTSAPATTSTSTTAMVATTATTVASTPAPPPVSADTTVTTVAPTAVPPPVSSDTPVSVQPEAPVPCATEGGPAPASLPGLVPFAVPSTAEVVEPGDDVGAAVDRAAEGSDGVVVLQDGLHPPVTIDSVGSVTIVGQSRDGTVVEGVVFDGAHDVTLRGMTVTGRADRETSAITVRSASSGITLMDLTVDPFHAAGVDIIDGSQNVLLQGSRITGDHVTRKLGPARNVHIGEGTPVPDRWVSGIEIRDNELLAAGADAIQVAGARDVLIEGNFIHDLQQNSDHNDGIQVVAVEGIVIEGNVLTTLTAPSQDQSIILGHLGGDVGPAAHPDLLITDRNGSNENLRGINNVFSDIMIEGVELPAVHSNNVIEGAGAGPLDLTADPCFVDRVWYELAPSSPAVDFGTPAEAPTVDLEGRPRSGAPDAGAMEPS